MSKRRLLVEMVVVNLIAWWGIRILSSQTALLHSTVENTPEWYLVRVIRAIITIAVVLGWARWRKVTWPDIGLGKQNFWRNFVIAVGVIAALWVAVVMVRGTSLLAPQPLAYPIRFLAIVTVFVDVVAQQLPTFGLLQNLGSRLLPLPAAFVLAWLSFGLAHFIIASPAMVILALVIGIFFGLALWRTGNLGLGLGAHFGVYFMLAILGWGA